MICPSVINSAVLVVGTNQMLFDASTLAVSNKDLEEFPTLVHITKQRNLVLTMFFFVSFHYLTTSRRNFYKAAILRLIMISTLVHFDQMRPESGFIWKPLWISRFLGNANQRKMAVALALILQKIN